MTSSIYKIAVVIPCYNVAKSISNVIVGLPDIVSCVIVVNDCSLDDTELIVSNMAKANSKITLLNNAKNLGVGGAMICGFKEAIRKKCDVVIKLDGDGQMDASYIPKMVEILDSGYDFVKGNRFFDRASINKMPKIRMLGNMGMGFIIKVVSGYWNISDPTNGFFAIKMQTLKQVDLSKLAMRFFFESSLLIELYYTGAKIKDIAMQSIYDNEKSNLSVAKSLFSFPPKLLRALTRRIWLRYFIYDFNIASLYILFGMPMFLFGIIFGAIKWYQYASAHVFAPTGTIMLSVISLILGFQMILAAVQYDMTAKSPFET